MNDAIGKEPSSFPYVMRLEAATEQDLERILQLQKKAFYEQALIYNDFGLPPLLQTIDDIRGEFRLKDFYKMEQDGIIVASVRCYIVDNVLHIEKLIVAPEFQNRSIGTSMMVSVENRYAHSVQRYELFTGHKSEKNFHLYGKLGYHEIRRETINDGLKLLHMEKKTSTMPDSGDTPN